MNWEKLKKLQVKNCFKLSPTAKRWDDAKSNPIEDLKAASEALSKCESFYMKSMRWVFGSHLKDRRN